MEHSASKGKSDIFHFRINPEVRREIETVYARSGLSLTPAINIFIQQSLNAGGFPFPVTAENAEYVKAQAMKRLMAELDKGRQSGESIPEAEVLRQFGVEEG